MQIIKLRISLASLIGFLLPSLFPSACNRLFRSRLACAFTGLVVRIPSVRRRLILMRGSPYRNSVTAPFIWRTRLRSEATNFGCECQSPKRTTIKPKLQPVRCVESNDKKPEQMAAFGERRSVSNPIEVMADERCERLAEQQGVAYAKTVRGGGISCWRRLL